MTTKVFLRRQLLSVPPTNQFSTIAITKYQNKLVKVIGPHYSAMLRDQAKILRIILETLLDKVSRKVRLVLKTTTYPNSIRAFRVRFNPTKINKETISMALAITKAQIQTPTKAVR